MRDLIICERSDLVAIADAVREKTGVTEKMSIDNIIDNIYNIENSNTSSTLEGSCEVSFPPASPAEKLYYIDPNYACHSVDRGIYSHDLTINVLKGSMILSNMAVFGNECYTCEGQPAILVKSSSSTMDAYAVIINGNVSFGYSDSAPV